MTNIRCSSCSLLNFAAAEACKRCGSPLGVADGAAQWEQPQDSYSQSADGAFYSQPYALATSASKSRGKGGWVVVVAILALLAIVGVPYVLKHRKAGVSNFAWKDYQAPDGSFSMTFPSAPKEMSMNQVTPAGNIQVHILQAEANKDGGCMLMYGDFPTKIQSLPLNQLGDQIVQKMTSGNQVFKVSSWRNISLSGYEGIELDLESSSSSPVSASGGARMYWVSPRLYVVLAAGTDSLDVDGLKSRCFDSFKLLK